VRVAAFGCEGCDPEEDEGGVVERLVSGDLEVVLPARRMGYSSARYGTKVRHKAENALRLLEIERDWIAVGVELDVGGNLLAIDGDGFLVGRPLCRLALWGRILCGLAVCGVAVVCLVRSGRGTCAGCRRDGKDQKRRRRIGKCGLSRCLRRNNQCHGGSLLRGRDQRR